MTYDGECKKCIISLKWSEGRVIWLISDLQRRAKELPDVCERSFMYNKIDILVGVLLHIRNKKNL